MNSADEFLAIFLILGSLLGIYLNIYCAKYFHQHLKDNTNRLVIPFVIGFVQSCLDATALIAFAGANIEFLVPGGFRLDDEFEEPIPSFFLFDGIIGMRAQINLFVSVYNYIKLLYPFTTYPFSFRTLTVFVTTVVSLSGTLPIIREILTWDRDRQVHRLKHNVVPRGLLYLYAFIYLYLFPTWITNQLYSTTIRTLGKNHLGNDEDDSSSESGDLDASEGNVFRVVIAELEKTYMGDGLMMGVMFGPVFLADFFINFWFNCTNLANPVDMERHWPQIIRLGAAIYPTLYVLMSLHRRRHYREPAAALLQKFHDLKERFKS